MNRNIRLLYLFIACAVFFIALPVQKISAAACPAGQKGEMKVITRDGDDRILKNIRWDLYKQVYDADSNPIPGTLVGSSNTGDAAMSSIIFDPLVSVGVGGDNNFIVRIYDVSRDAGEFYYTHRSIICGSVNTLDANLSSIKVIIRDKNKVPIKNRSFELYTQKRDVLENAIVNETVSKTLNTGETGFKVIYVTAGSYIIKIPAIDNKFIYTQPDIRVSGSAETEFDYTLSNVTISIRDGQGNLLINIPFNAYKQEKDADGNFIIGESVNSYNTGPDGLTGIFLPTGNYAFRFNGAGGEYYYLWNQQINETKSYIIDYRLSNVNVIVRDARGELLPKSNFDVYKQARNADGKFIVGEHIARFTTGDSGIAPIFLPSGNYAFRFEGTALQYQYLWDQFVGVSGSQSVNFNLSTLKIVVTGVDNTLLKNIQITLYKQNTDEQGSRILGAKIGNVSTGDAGSAVFYVPEGTYVASIKSPDAKDIILWNQEVKDSQYTSVAYTLAALDITVKNANNDIVKKTIVEIYEQSHDANGGVLLGKLVGSKSTENTGRVIFYYPPGAYAIKIKATLGYEHYIWEKKIIEQKITKIRYFLGAIRIIVRDGAKNPIKGASVTVATQKNDFSGKSVFDKNIATIITSDSGYGDVYLPRGSYAVIIGTEKKFDVRVNDYLITTVEIEKIDVGAYTVKSVRVPAPIGTRKEGTLIKASDSPAVYVIRNGEKRPIVSAEVFTFLGYSWKSVITVSAVEAEIYPDGIPLAFGEVRRPDGTLIKTAGDRGVYLIEGGKKRIIVSAQDFILFGYNWSRIISISAEEFASYPPGEALSYNKIKEGNLIKLSSSPSIYVIENGTKRAIPSARLFLARGYLWKNVLIVSDVEFSQVPDGDALAFDSTDEDQDGLNYEEEVLFGTDLAVDDTDNDGFLDGEEVHNGFNPLGEGKLK